MVPALPMTCLSVIVTVAWLLVGRVTFMDDWNVVVQFTVAAVAGLSVAVSAIVVLERRRDRPGA